MAVAFALVAIAIGIWLNEDEAEVKNSVGIVADWRVELAVPPYPEILEPREVAANVIGSRVFEAIWRSNPCSEHPSILITGSPRDLHVSVDPASLAATASASSGGWS